MCTCSESTAKILPALLEAQKEIENLKLHKDGYNPHFQSRFLSLEGVLRELRPILSRHGLLLVQSPATGPEGDCLTVESTVFHISGEWLSASITLPLGQKRDAQAVGSALSYGRRFLLCSTFALAGDADDDAENCCRRPATSQSQRPAQARPAEAPGRLSEAEIEGVTFKRVEEQGGTFLVAEGKTREAAEALKRQGFRWNGKAWWRVA